MRKSSNVHCAIVAPDFVNLKLYQDGFKVTVSLPISGDMYEYFQKIRDPRAICYRGRFYLHWEKSYLYLVAETECSPFSVGFEDAETALIHLQIMAREAKVVLLNREIDCLKCRR